MKVYDEFPRTGIHGYVANYIRDLPDLTGKKVLDIPCGDGRATYEFLRKGAEVVALDLFPQFMRVDEVQAGFADLSEKLPVESDSIDYIICQEGIEHVPNQLQVLEEFNRVLKKGGILLVSTPSNSHVRAKLSHFLFESDYWKRMPPTEVDSIWFADDNMSKMYFGHYFLLGVQHFQSILTLSGFSVTNRIKTKISTTSLLLGVPFYPLFGLMNLLSYWVYRKKNKHVSQKDKDRLFLQRVKLNLSPKSLFCRHLFWEMRKESELSGVIEKLKKIKRV